MFSIEQVGRQVVIHVLYEEMRPMTKLKESVAEMSRLWRVSGWIAHRQHLFTLDPRLFELDAFEISCS
jgi:hypothetical protein